MSTFERVLVPVDFSAATPGVVRCATELAKRYGASLVLLHVHVAATDEGLEVPVRFGGDSFDASRADRELALSALASDARGAGAAVTEALIVSGEPSREIVARARAHRCDLVVMGTHGRTGLSRLLMGSVAEAVVRHAPCSVLTVRAPVRA